MKRLMKRLEDIALDRLDRWYRAQAPSHPVTPAQAAAPVSEVERLRFDRVVVEVGPALLRVATDGAMVERLKGTRRAVSREWGVPLAPLAVRDHPGMAALAYRVMLDGQVLGEGALQPGRLLALGVDDTRPPPGDEPLVREPAFGLPARWVDAARAGALRAAGCTVVDVETALATHVGELLRARIADLLGFTELDGLLRQCAEARPGEVAALEPAGLARPTLLIVLREVLRSGRPVAPFAAVLEAVLLASVEAKTPDALVPKVLAALPPPSAR